jgi:hypothetical protein
MLRLPLVKEGTPFVKFPGDKKNILDFTLSSLALVKCECIMQMFNIDNIQSPSRRKEEVYCSAQSGYTERLIPSLIKGVIQMPSSDGGRVDRDTDRRILHKPTLGK